MIGFGRDLCGSSSPTHTHTREEAEEERGISIMCSSRRNSLKQGEMSRMKMEMKENNPTVRHFRERKRCP